MTLLGLITAFVGPPKAFFPGVESRGSHFLGGPGVFSPPSGCARVLKGGKIKGREAKKGQKERGKKGEDNAREGQGKTNTRGGTKERREK